jgi:hypothetical protein
MGLAIFKTITLTDFINTKDEECKKLFQILRESNRKLEV